MKNAVHTCIIIIHLHERPWSQYLVFWGACKTFILISSWIRLLFLTPGKHDMTLLSISLGHLWQFQLLKYIWKTACFKDIWWHKTVTLPSPWSVKEYKICRFEGQVDVLCNKYWQILVLDLCITSLPQVRQVVIHYLKWPYLI